MVGTEPGCGAGGPFSVSLLVVGVGCKGAYLCAAPVGAGIADAPACACRYEFDDDVNVVVAGAGAGAGFEVCVPSEA
jgi:hypothetical protein